jgi:hypothetical protein
MRSAIGPHNDVRGPTVTSLYSFEKPTDQLFDLRSVKDQLAAFAVAQRLVARLLLAGTLMPTLHQKHALPARRVALTDTLVLEGTDLRSRPLVERRKPRAKAAETRVFCAATARS